MSYKYFIVDLICQSLKKLKREHKKLENITNKAAKVRLNDHTPGSWKSLRELKKLKLQVQVKDKINQLKH